MLGQEENNFLAILDFFQDLESHPSEPFQIRNAIER